MKKLDLKEIQNEELEMLKQIICFMDEKNIKYYICYGTLLGAVRHKGFIPWDDDIDVMLPRPDYKKFQEIVKKNGNKINSNLDVLSYDLNNMSFPYGKVINKTLVLDEKCTQEETQKYLWIDIFPMDGVSDNEKENINFFKKVLKLRNLLIIVSSSDTFLSNYRNGKWNLLPKLIIKRIFKNKKEKIAKKYDKLTQKYNYNSSKYVASVVWGEGPQEILSKEKIKEDTKLTFEGIETNAFKCYKEYLTNMYGDYMQLPPIEKRYNHELTVYKKEDGVKNEEDSYRVCNK